MQKKYQVFISSTFRDLADERQDAMRAVLDLGDIPSGMEIFPAAGRPAANGCTRSSTTAPSHSPQDWRTGEAL
jgi:hypothetical protein